MEAGYICDTVFLMSKGGSEVRLLIILLLFFVALLVSRLASRQNREKAKHQSEFKLRTFLYLYQYFTGIRPVFPIR